MFEPSASWMPVAIVVFACVTASVACRAIRRYSLWESGIAVLLLSGGVLFSSNSCLGEVFACFDFAFFLILVGRMQEARKQF
jgi:hypothetical protein